MDSPREGVSNYTSSQDGPITSKESFHLPRDDKMEVLTLYLLNLLK